MKKKILFLGFMFFYCIVANSQTEHKISLNEIIDIAGHGNIVPLQIAEDYSFLKNIPNIKCDLSAINSFKMNQYVRNDSIPNQMYFFVGVNEHKKEKYVVLDANKNHDFSDDTIYTFALPDKELSREEKLKRCIGVEITLDPLLKSTAHIGVDPFNFFLYNDSLSQDNRLQVVITFGDYMTVATQIEDLPIEIDADKSWNLFNRKLKEQDEFIIRYKDSSSKIDYRSFRKGDTIYIGDRLMMLTKVDHPDIYLKSVGILSDSSSVGTFVPAVYLKDLESYDNIALNKLIEGKYTFIDFWGSWCGPCIASLPKLKDFYEKVKDREDVLMLGVASEDIRDLGKLKKIINDQNIQWENCWIERGGKKYINTVEKKLDIKSYPTYLIIDNTGKIVYRDHSMFKTEEAIEFFLKMIE